MKSERSFLQTMRLVALRKRLLTALCLLLLFALAGCTNANGTGMTSNNILLWHSWPPEEAMVLEEVLSQIGEIDASIEVITLHVEPEEILESYVEAIEQGIGPDLLLGEADWIGQLADVEAVRPLSDKLRFLLEFRTNALEAVKVGDQIYGTPMAAAPYALYVNQGLTSEVPGGLNELLEIVSAEVPLAMVPRFEPAYWGISAFGTGLFDSKGRLTLATSGFTEWLTWLEAAQEEAGIILNPDAEALRELFMSGRAAYYVGNPNELPIIAARIEPDSLAVYRLPNGPFGPAGPLIDATAVMLGTNSSDAQTAIAQTVADFLTNRQQSTTFMRELGHIPANADVEVDLRIYPLLGGFARQLTSSIALPNTIDLAELEVAGNRAYVNTLSGLMSPEEAVCLFGWDVIETEELNADDVDLPQGCERPQPPTATVPATQ